MAIKCFDATVSAAALQAMSANTYYWIGRDGSLTSVGGGALVGVVGITPPPQVALLDCSPFVCCKFVASHGALTGAAGGKVSTAQLIPDGLPPTGAPLVMGASTMDQALAATAESVFMDDLNPPTNPRMGLMGMAILFTTAPSPASPLRVSMWGYRQTVEIGAPAGIGS